MPRFATHFMARTAILGAACLLALAGCGTTRSSDSLRTATEQLLISDAIDRAVQTVDFQPLTRQTVYLDDARLKDVVDREYLVSTLRQHLLASGCTLKNSRDDADFVVEVRAGAVGTDRSDLLFGIPATNVPQILPLQGVPAAIPEVPLAKRRDQRGVAKISMFAYHRESGQPVWQSGVAARESSSNDVWLFGAGPFQYGSILKQQTAEADGKGGASTERDADDHRGSERVRLAQRAVFASPATLVQQFRRLPPATAVASDETKDGPKPAAAEIAASTPPPAPFRPSSLDAQLLIPGLAEAADPKKQVVPRLTGNITEEQLLRNAAPKTVEMSTPAYESNSIVLPQPRFDSL